MSELDYYNPLPQDNGIRAEEALDMDSGHHQNILLGIFRRWPTVLLAFIFCCATGIPAVLFLVKPKYMATAAIQVAPTVDSILFPDQQSDRVLPMYPDFKNTQAQHILGPTVLQRVADELAKQKGLSICQKREPTFVASIKKAWKEKDANILFFKEREPIDALRHSQLKGDLVVVPERRSWMITISMKSPTAYEAELIVNAFLDAYKEVVLSELEQADDKKCSLLEEEKRAIAKKIEQQEFDIERMAAEYGNTDLTKRHQFMLDNVAMLQTQLTEMKGNQASLDTQTTQIREANADPVSEGAKLKQRTEFINTDERVKRLNETIIKAEEDLIRAELALAATNPRLKDKVKVIEALKTRLEERSEQLHEQYDESLTQQMSMTADRQLSQAESLSEYYTATIEKLTEELVNANANAIALGRKNQLIKKRQTELDRTKERHNTISDRIVQLRMEQKRPARISTAYRASSVLAPTKATKLLVAVVFASFAFGVALAFFRDKIDKSLRTPDDVVRVVGTPIIGTTVCTDRLARKALPDHVANDYQTIRANLKILNHGTIPKTLVVTSAGVREGKTTFSINLASSLAKTGSRVLLIDGDFRKPDIGLTLNLPVGPLSFRDVVNGVCDLEDVVCTMPLNGLHILANNGTEAADPVELLSQQAVKDCLDSISKRYDHVIIDTPPVLVAPDAQLWAQMADAVVLSSFAGLTAGPALREALERLAQAKVKVLGNVLSSVREQAGYGRYGYGYGSSGERHIRKNSALLLLPEEAELQKS